MKVKVQCPCGARFEFEVEPANGRMPVRINCPVCNADATELANAVIQQQSAAPVLVPAPGLRIAKSPSAHIAPVPEPVAASAVSTEPNAPGDSTVQLCPKHQGEAAVDSCVVCGKPICPKCMEQFGHVCSVFCRQQAEQKRIYVPVYAGQKSVMAAKSRAFVKLISLAVTLVVVAILGLWFWYTWFGRNPKIVYSVTFGQSGDSPEQRVLRPPEFYKLIAPDRLLSIKNKHAILFDVSKNEPLWSSPLKGGSDSEDAGLLNPLVAVTTNDIWLAFPGGLVRLDRQTGALKDNSVHGRIFSFAQQDGSLTVGFTTPDGERTLARISLPEGSIQTASLGARPAAKPAQITTDKKHKDGHEAAPAAELSAEEQIDQGRTVTASTGSGVQSGIRAATGGSVTVDPAEYLDDATSFGFSGDEILPFIASGPGVVQLQTRLLEQKTITHQAMKAQGKSVLEGTVTASQGLDLAQEMANNAQREETGGVEIEDVSRYQVTLHRWFAGDAPDWTGEVTGPPQIYPLKTLDLLVAGQSVTVFDHNNKKLWEGKLSYPMTDNGNHPPVLETADAVYVADPGVLNCFDRGTGTARWRLNSVGISSVQAGERGNIYITTTTAGPDKIKYSQEHNIREKIHPVIMKVDPATGKVLWRNQSVGNACVMSGKFLYSTWATQTQSALKLDEGPDIHFYIDLLNPASGQTIWNFRVEGQPVERVEIQQNWILLRFADKLYVLKFFSL